MFFFDAKSIGIFILVPLYAICLPFLCVLLISLINSWITVALMELSNFVELGFKVRNSFSGGHALKQYSLLS